MNAERKASQWAGILSWFDNERAVTEVTGAMAALGMLLALWGCLLSLHRYGRIL